MLGNIIYIEAMIFCEAKELYSVSVKLRGVWRPPSVAVSLRR